MRAVTNKAVSMQKQAEVRFFWTLPRPKFEFNNSIQRPSIKWVYRIQVTPFHGNSLLLLFSLEKNVYESKIIFLYIFNPVLKLYIKILFPCLLLACLLHMYPVLPLRNQTGLLALQQSCEESLATLPKAHTEPCRAVTQVQASPTFCCSVSCQMRLGISQAGNSTWYSDRLYLNMEVSFTSVVVTLYWSIFSWLFKLQTPPQLLGVNFLSSMMENATCLV